MKTLKKIGIWLKENPWAVVVSLVSVFGAYLLYKSKANKIASLQDAVEVQSALKRVAADEARAIVILETADAKEEDIKAIDKRIAASKRRVVEIHENKDVEGMDDEELARLFSDSGL